MRPPAGAQGPGHYLLIQAALILCGTPATTVATLLLTPAGAGPGHYLLIQAALILSGTQATTVATLLLTPAGARGLAIIC